ncbi:uncharacterized protein PSFLO_07161 [Pseudozyma flocculosa]|uniref:Uncharacterized protein n=1 Tax=Pseudozyma flocculosa TaxID=84751 RepID=A0A5C3FEA0_9BASI|nr:uncharacterized protein PSFLO_07161 [Pseudozyma flocculosa]
MSAEVKEEGISSLGSNWCSRYSPFSPPDDVLMSGAACKGQGLLLVISKGSCSQLVRFLSSAPGMRSAAIWDPEFFLPAI